MSYEELHAGGKEQGNLFAACFGKALGKHLGKKINDSRGDYRAVDNVLLGEPAQYKQSRERGAGCVENVIADEYGGNGFVKAVADPKGLDGTLVTLIRQSAQAHLAYTGISSFTAGEIRRTEKKEYI